EDLAFRFPTRLRVLLGCSRVSTLSPGQFICEDDIVSTKCPILEPVLLVDVVKRTEKCRFARSDLNTQLRECNSFKSGGSRFILRDPAAGHKKSAFRRLINAAAQPHASVCVADNQVDRDEWRLHDDAFE